MTPLDRMNEETNRAGSDRLDAVVIGASVEGLVAAAMLAKAGRTVAVLERQANLVAVSPHEDAVISLEVARALDLVAHGLRFAPPPAVAAVSGDRALILWPEAHAARTSIAAFSPRDADALDAFHARLARASVITSSDQSAVHWLTSNMAPVEPDERVLLRLSSLARVLDESFDNELLKGTWAQGAIARTGASPLSPCSGVLLIRLSLLAAAAPELGYRFVAGGRARLVQALLAALRFYNNAEVRFASEVKEITTERDAAQGVGMSDGSAVQAPVIVSSLSAQRSLAMLSGLRRRAPTPVGLSSGGNLEPARVRLTLGAIPRLPGVDAATLASGAIVRLNPSIRRLVQAYGAFRGRVLSAEPCLELRLTTQTGMEARPRWELVATMPYLPPVTVEGPWVGPRRDRVRALCVKMIDTMAPGFAASVESAEIIYPKESETVMDPRGPAALVAKASLDAAGLPEPQGAAAPLLVKGVALLEPSIYASEGDAGLLAANAVLGTGTKARADA